MTEQIRDIQKRYGSRVMVIAIVVGLVCILLGHKPWGKGLILGSIFSIVNFVLMGLALPASIQPSSKKSALTALKSIGFRYLLLAVPLYVGITQPQFHVAGVIIGLFMIQIVIVLEGIHQYIQNIQKNRSAG